MTRRWNGAIAIVVGVLACGCKKKAASTEAAAQTADTVAAKAQQAVSSARNDFMSAVTPPANAAKAGDVIGVIIDETAASLPPAMRQDWDPAAIVAVVGKDRTALFRWVRDHTVLVPYRGSLRGAVGVLMDRTGNSLDRALLLAEMLHQSSDLPVQLANAALPEDKIAQLAKVYATRSPPARSATPTVNDLIPRFATLVGGDANALHSKYAAMMRARAELGTQARARIAAQTKTIAGLVPAAAAAAPDLSAFADHWWVQVQDPDGHWIDLDPSLPDADEGQTLAPSDRTLAPADIGDDLSHTLTLRVIGEVWHDGQREEANLVEHTFAPRNFYGQKIAITNIPIDMPSDDKMMASPDPGATARTALAAQTEWMPAIMIGGTPVAKTTVTDAGEVWDMSGDANSVRLARGISNETKRTVGAATSMLDDLPGSDSGDQPVQQPPLAPVSGFTAEWLELEIRAPGAPPRIVRRPIFETVPDGGKPAALSEAARLDRGFALVSETEVLPLFAQVPGTFVADRAVKALVADRATLIDMARSRGKAMPSELRDRIGKMAPLPSALYELAFERVAWSPVADQTYIDRLDVFARRQGLHLVGDKLRPYESIDIVSNGVGVWPKAKDARAVRIAQGVTDTVAETLIQVDCTDAGCYRENASDRLATDGASSLHVSTPADGVGLPPRVRALTGNDAAAGYAVLLPAKSSPKMTWWRVDPQTGETLGMGVAGGISMTEYALMFFNVVAPVVNCYAMLHSPGASMATIPVCIGGMVLGVIGAGALYQGAADVAAAGGLAAGGEFWSNVGNTISLVDILTGMWGQIQGTH